MDPEFTTVWHIQKNPGRALATKVQVLFFTDVSFRTAILQVLVSRVWSLQHVQDLWKLPWPVKTKLLNTVQCFIVLGHTRINKGRLYMGSMIKGMCSQWWLHMVSVYISQKVLTLKS